ncbi:MAG: Asp-tRNA(Asn)/Glu-tRNA(Gln) amidotransferase subunit GatB [Anaerolineaceae bacterium]|nr:Asp-tRNA(Asn)/Glu-tRNA(Gln) amidotransferase subunit GatB [Anaerolineaceae bacterium]
MGYEAVIGLEVHAELQTCSKMFCACPVVDTTQSPANTAVCPVCAGMPGALPVLNRQAVESGLRVALALDCTIAPASQFARKNYFYPDLPKGYQISQYESPLAEHGWLMIFTQAGERRIRIRRVHLEEDTGKLTHVHDGEVYSLVDLNRAGIPLLEIVSEPDLHSVEEVRAYASGLRALLRSLGVNSGDMEKGVIRFEANVSVRPQGSTQLGTRVEIKNLNSFRALDRAIAYEIVRQSHRLKQGERVAQETLGWNESRGETVSQRSKEEAHDYRYFPEPDLPLLVIGPDWVERVRAGLPELPQAKKRRFREQYGLAEHDAALLAGEGDVAAYFEAAALAGAQRGVTPKVVANWLQGELFGLINQAGGSLGSMRVTPEGLAELLELQTHGEINILTAKAILAEMATTGDSPVEILAARGLSQLSDAETISRLIAAVLAEHPQEVRAYLSGKTSLGNWFFGQVMQRAHGQANPEMVKAEMANQLEALTREEAGRRAGYL